MGNNYNNNEVTKNNENEAGSLLENYVKKESKTDISENAIMNLFKKFGDKAKDIINKLIDNNKLVDNDGTYEIM